MDFFQPHAAFHTDHYQLAMAQGYFLTGRHTTQACFDYFFRKLPYDGGYAIFAGLGDLLPMLENYRFSEEQLEHLAAMGFDAQFIAYLKNFEFKGRVLAPREGEVIFPNVPILRVEGSIIEGQLAETLLLNTLNFQSLIATKAARIRHVVGPDRSVIDFGLRRAQGLGGLNASRAALIGGADTTSNVLAGQLYGANSVGTMAHSWIESFDDELSAFRAFADTFPDNGILLVDTYSTLQSGVPNAITVAREMEQRGHKLRGVRLDSGDLAYLAKKTRQLLDDAGLHYVKIVVSNQLDEYIIKSLLEQGAPLDVFGVGTRLVTGKPNAALDGVYKLSMSAGQPRMKLSENIEKMLLPGIKDVFRCSDVNGRFYADAVVRAGEERPRVIYHPHQSGKHSDVALMTQEPFHTTVMSEGRILAELPDLATIRDYAQQRLARLPDEHKRFDYPHTYKVGISKQLQELRDQMVADIRANLNVPT